MHGFKMIVKEQGVYGLFSGTVPTLLRDVPFAALYLFFYRCFNNYKTTFGSTLMIGAFSATLASLLTHPFDMIKTRMQLNSNSVGLITTCKTIIESDGIRGFMKGIHVRILRKGASSGITWAVYEEVMKQVISNSKQ